MKNVFFKLEEHIKSSYKSERREELENELDKILGNRGRINHSAIRLNEDEVKSRLTNERDKEMIGAYFETKDEYDDDTEDYSINLNYHLLSQEFLGNDISRLEEVLDETMPLQSVINDILESAQCVLKVLDNVVQELITECGDTLNEYTEMCKNNISLPNVESDEFKALVRKYLHTPPEFIISETLTKTIPKENGYRHSRYNDKEYLLINETKDYADVYIINMNNDTVRYERFTNGERLEVSKNIPFDDILSAGETLNGYDLSESVETYITLRDYFKTI